MHAAVQLCTHHHQMVAVVAPLHRPHGKVRIHHATVSASSQASGWEAFDEDDVDFMESLRPDSPARAKTSPAVRPATATPNNAVVPPAAVTSVPSPSSASLWPVVRRPDTPRDNPRASSLGRPAPPQIRPTSSPSKPPPPKKIFRDVDPLISVYSTIQVSVTDSMEEETSEEPPSSSATSRPPLPPSKSRSPLSSFNDLAGRSYKYALRLRKNMAASGLQLPTPIQQYAIPVINAGEAWSGRGCMGRNPIHHPIEQNAVKGLEIYYILSAASPPHSYITHRTRYAGHGPHRDRQDGSLPGPPPGGADEDAAGRTAKESHLPLSSGASTDKGACAAGD